MTDFLTSGQAAVAAGIEYARANDARMAVVVMDVTGTVCAAARMDHARTIVYDIALAKANTAREFENRTSELKDRVAVENKAALTALSPRPIAFLGGGLPIMRAGHIDGAIGASGGSEAQDIECAEVALRAFLATREDAENG